MLKYCDIQEIFQEKLKTSLIKKRLMVESKAIKSKYNQFIPKEWISSNEIMCFSHDQNTYRLNCYKVTITFQIKEQAEDREYLCIHADDLLVDIFKYDSVSDYTKKTGKGISWFSEYRENKHGVYYISFGNKLFQTTPKRQYAKFITIQGLLTVFVKYANDIKDNAELNLKKLRQLHLQAITSVKLQYQDVTPNQPFFGEYFEFSGENNRIIYVPIFGTREDPLFLANDILVQLLKYVDIKQCNFWNQFLQDSQLAVRLVDHQVKSQLDQSVKYYQEYSITGNLCDAIYLTESGLYKCLMRSQQPIANKFQTSIILFFRGIKAGNIQVLIQKDSELAKFMKTEPDLFTQLAFDRGQLNHRNATDNIKQLQGLSLQDQIPELENLLEIYISIAEVQQDPKSKEFFEKDVEFIEEKIQTTKERIEFLELKEYQRLQAESQKKKDEQHAEEQRLKDQQLADQKAASNAELAETERRLKEEQARREESERVNKQNELFRQFQAFVDKTIEDTLVTQHLIDHLNQSINQLQQLTLVDDPSQDKQLINRKLEYLRKHLEKQQLVFNEQIQRNGKVYLQVVDGVNIQSIQNQRFDDKKMNMSEEKQKRILKRFDMAFIKIDLIRRILQYCGKHNAADLIRDSQHIAKSKEVELYLLENKIIKEEPKYLMFNAIKLMINSLFPTEFRGLDFEQIFTEKVLISGLQSEIEIRLQEDKYISRLQPLLNVVRPNEISGGDHVTAYNQCVFKISKLQTVISDKYGIPPNEFKKLIMPENSNFDDKSKSLLSATYQKYKQQYQTQYAELNKLNNEKRAIIQNHPEVVSMSNEEYKDDTNTCDLTSMNLTNQNQVMIENLMDQIKQSKLQNIKKMLKQNRLRERDIINLDIHQVKEFLLINNKTDLLQEVHRIWVQGIEDFNPNYQEWSRIKRRCDKCGEDILLRNWDNHQQLIAKNTMIKECFISSSLVNHIGVFLRKSCPEHGDDAIEIFSKYINNDLVCSLKEVTYWLQAVLEQFYPILQIMEIETKQEHCASLNSLLLWINIDKQLKENIEATNRLTPNSWNSQQRVIIKAFFEAFKNKTETEGHFESEWKLYNNFNPNYIFKNIKTCLQQIHNFPLISITTADYILSISPLINLKSFGNKPLFLKQQSQDESLPEFNDNNPDLQQEESKTQHYNNESQSDEPEETKQQVIGGVQLNDVKQSTDSSSFDLTDVLPDSQDETIIIDTTSKTNDVQDSNEQQIAEVNSPQETQLLDAPQTIYQTQDLEETKQHFNNVEQSDSQVEEESKQSHHNNDHVSTMSSQEETKNVAYMKVKKVRKNCINSGKNKEAKPCKCPYPKCNKLYANLTNLKKHINDKHGDYLVTNQLVMNLTTAAEEYQIPYNPDQFAQIEDNEYSIICRYCKGEIQGIDPVKHIANCKSYKLQLKK